ncbi:MAG: AAA family ATPase [Candidatus Hermodarchaeota archaeon]
MHITKLSFKNFMGYKNLNIPNKNNEFPEGLILISGKNSYGKSTILEGILFAFFGPKIFKGRNAASFITYGEQDKAEIYVYFTLDKKKYYIYRKWGRTGSITAKLFEWNKGRNTYSEIKNFNVEKFFEISSEQAMSTVFVRQGEVEELANKKGAELREMIIDLFRLNIIDTALSFLDTKFKGQKFEKEKLEKSRVPIERIKKDIEDIEKENIQLKKDAIEKEKIIKNLSKEQKSFPSKELISELENLYKQNLVLKDKFQSYYNDFNTKIKKTNLNLEDFSSRKTMDNKIETLSSNKTKFQMNKEDLEKKRDATFKGLGKTKGKIEDNKKAIKEMETSLKFIKKGEGKELAQCPTCQSELTKEHYDEVIQKFTKEISVNQKKIDSISRVLTDFDKKISTNQSDLDKIKEKITIYQGLKEDFENYIRNESEFKKSEKDLKDFLSKHGDKFQDSSAEGVKEIILAKERVSAELKANKKEFDQINLNFQKNNERIKKLHNEILKMTDLQRKIDEHEIDLEHITKAKEFVRRFVTEYMVVKRLVKNIALSTDKYIKDFTSGQYSDLLLDLSGTKKTGLSLRIRDNFNGEYESTEVLSGGDRTALGIALRLAISELMGSIRPTKESPRKNPKIDFLLLDEPLAALDETRRERILKHLIKSKTFSQIFLITHTAIPQDIDTSKIIVDKDLSTGISKARFEKPTIVI